MANRMKEKNAMNKKKNNSHELDSLKNEAA